MANIFSVLAVGLAGALGLMVQPMMGKIMLPGMGGGSGVWTASSVFFQATLLLGYAYAAWLQGRSVRCQRVIHGTLLVFGALSLVLPAPPVTGELPAVAWFLMKTACFPMLAVYSTSPLLQGWLSSENPARMSAVYRLFAMSNLAAIAGLLSYPFVVERFLDVDRQFFVWSCAYAILCACFVPLLRVLPATRRGGSPGFSAWQWRWWLVPMVSTALMLAVVARVTRDTSPTPFVWVAALSLYLLSYALVFAVDWARRWRAVFAAEAPIAAAAMLVLLAVSPSPDLASMLLLAVSFFSVCAFLHGELSLSRPSSRGLPAFYVAMSAGGFAGGVAMMGMPWLLDSDAEIFALLPLVASFAVGVGTMGFRPKAGLAASVVVFVAMMAWGLSAGIAPGQKPGWSLLARGRTFFGSYRVEERETQRVLVHNGTVHGAQQLEIGQQREPTTYYSKQGPLGAAWVTAMASGGYKPNLSVGVIGLGAGTAAAYADAGDRLDFYEIDPEVVDVMPRYFSFVDDARRRGAAVSFLVGDGRKLLESSPPCGYDILVVDAFSGDSVPSHLISREAFAEYSRHLAPSGVLAVHASNRNLDLPAVARASARASSMDFATLMGASELDGVKSVWVLASRSKERLRPIRSLSLGKPPGGSSREVLWTDRFSDVLSVLK